MTSKILLKKIEDVTKEVEQLHISHFKENIERKNYQKFGRESSRKKT